MVQHPQTWLIRGGAGYIGSRIADELLQNGSNVVIYDSLQGGLELRVDYLRAKHPCEVPLIVADIRDNEKFEEILKKYGVSGIIHCAALKSVDESIEKRNEYMEVNYHATVSILETAKQVNVKFFIFCSSALLFQQLNNSVARLELYFLWETISNVCMFATAASQSELSLLIYCCF